MSFERWVENSWIEPRATSPEEIRDLLSIVGRALSDARVEAISDDLRVVTAFNAILTSATIALRASGYRILSRGAHHHKTIESLEITLHAEEDLIRKIMGVAKKRNATSYDSAGNVTQQDVQHALHLATEIQERIIAWLKSVHPNLVAANEP